MNHDNVEVHSMEYGLERHRQLASLHYMGVMGVQRTMIMIPRLDYRGTLQAQGRRVRFIKPAGVQSGSILHGL